LEQLLDEKAVKKFGKKFAALGIKQKDSMYYEIVESSARPAAKFNTLNKVLNVSGKVLIVVTVAYATYEISNAENKPKEAIKQGVVIGGGVLGTVISGTAVGMVCGPGAPICTIALLLAGGASAGWFASKGVEFFDDELDEFTKWQIR
ncbi:MAG TPA: hypothetical protein DIW52_12155, partial [Pseudomonas sp.]|nr:hypothetical protein [Pseudomonas sp.]